MGCEIAHWQNILYVRTGEAMVANFVFGCVCLGDRGWDRILIIILISCVCEVNDEALKMVVVIYS